MEPQERAYEQAEQPLSSAKVIEGRTYEEIQAQWYAPEYWSTIHHQVGEIDALIGQFNEMTGLLKALRVRRCG